MRAASLAASRFSRKTVARARGLDVARIAQSASSSRRWQSGAPQSRTNFGVAIVPQQSAWVIERFGRYHMTLEPGISLLIPFVDSISYVHVLKEQAVPVHAQTAITRDNVAITIDGVLYIKIVDAYKASYMVEDPQFAVTQLAQTTMRSELGKLTMDQAFQERDALNHAIVNSINEAAVTWGIECLRYEIRDIAPPQSIRIAMDMQAEAERRKRAEILESEGTREAAINTAQGEQQATQLRAQGEAAAIVAKAKATAEGVERLARAVRTQGGQEAVSLRIAEQYVSAFARIAQKGNTIMLPGNASDAASMVTQAMTIYKSIQSQQSVRDSSSEDRSTVEQRQQLEDVMVEERDSSLGSNDISWDDAEQSTAKVFKPKAF